jgi:hypothetical protein
MFKHMQKSFGVSIAGAIRLKRKRCIPEYYLAGMAVWQRVEHNLFLPLVLKVLP